MIGSANARPEQDGKPFDVDRLKGYCKLTSSPPLLYGCRCAGLMGRVVLEALLPAGRRKLIKAKLLYQVEQVSEQ